MKSSFFVSSLTRLGMALALALAYTPSQAVAGTPENLAAPTQLTLSTNPAACSLGPLEWTGTTTAECVNALNSGKQVLVSFTWSDAPCGSPVCEDPRSFYLYSGGVQTTTNWYIADAGSLGASSVPQTVQGLAVISSLPSKCVTVRAYSGGTPAWSVDSNQACLPSPSPTPFPIHRPILHPCVGPSDQNPNHLPQCM